MRSKSLVIILFIILIIDLFGLMFVIFYKNPKYKSLDVLKINNEYETLEGFANEFNTERKKIYELVFNEVIVSDLNTNYQNYILEFNSYEKILKRFNENTKYLKKICYNNELMIKDVIKKCETYKGVYKKSNNLFIDDVKALNEKIITRYNELNEEKKLDLYVSKLFNEYIK